MSVGVLWPWREINLSAVTRQILGSRGTPSKFVVYALKEMYAKFGAFTRFVTIFVNFDANGLDYKWCVTSDKKGNVTGSACTACLCFNSAALDVVAIFLNYTTNGYLLITCVQVHQWEIFINQNLQYCAKVMQAKCANFVLCSLVSNFRAKVRSKVRA